MFHTETTIKTANIDWTHLGRDYKIGVTTAVDPTEALTEGGVSLSKDLGCTFVERGRRGLNALFARYAIDRLFVITQEQLVLHGRETHVFWSPGTAYLKLWQPSTTKPLDSLIATDLKPGDTLLDCTLGFGSDAIVFSWAVGQKGSVVGLEADGPLAYLTYQGLKQYLKGPEQMLEAMKRIQVQSIHHLSYLKLLPNDAFDVVYFDPMFVEGVEGSKGISPLRQLACQEGVSSEAWQEALRVAKKRVVIKERIGSGIFEQFQVQSVVGGWRRGQVAYGIYENAKKY